MMKFKEWKGQPLFGTWEVSYKIDGVNARKNSDGVVVSKGGKPLYNCDSVVEDGKIYEIFAGSWEESITATRTKDGDEVPKEYAYELYPEIDPRLRVGTYTDLTSEFIQKLLREALTAHYEGLVLHRDGVRIKVKPSRTYDVKIVDMVEGKGRLTGSLGALITDKGKIGTGFTDKERQEIWNQGPAMIGRYVEAKCMGLTPKGVMRHSRFIRLRPDKDKV